MTLIYWLLCVLIAAVPAFLLYRSDRKKNIPLKWLPASLRFLTVFLTAALLLAPAFPSSRTEEEAPLLLWLHDNSTSAGAALGKDTVLYREKVGKLSRQWSGDYTLVPFTYGSKLRKDSILRFDERTTNMAEALQDAVAQYQDQNIGAVILSGDGVFNEGLDPLYAQLGLAVPVYTIGLGDSTQPKDLLVSRVYANKTVALNATFEILVDIRAEKLMGEAAELSIVNNGKKVAGARLNIDKDRFTGSLRFEAKAGQKGFQKYTAVLSQLKGESNIINNRMDFVVEVVDQQAKILLLAAAPHPDLAAIAAALEAVPQYKVIQRVGVSGAPDLTGISVVIAHQVPSTTGIQLAAAKIPVWYILGRQSNMALFNNSQSVLSIAGSNAINDVTPITVPGFSYYTLPEEINAVLAKMPPLQVPFGNYSSGPGTQDLLRQQIGNVATNYPLWTFSADEVPQSVLCGEGIWRWRMYEYKNYRRHQVVDELIRQTVGFLNVKKDDRPFRVFMDKYVCSDSEPINIFAELKNEKGELVNQPEAALQVKDSSGKEWNYKLEKTGNSYRLNIGLLAAGSYRYSGSVLMNGRKLQSEGMFVVESAPLEQLRTHADFDLLYKLAQQSGGQFFTLQNMEAISDSLKNNAVVKPVIHEDKIYRQLIDFRWLFPIILIFAAAEWLLRKYWNV